MLTRQLATLLRAGIPLAESLAALVEQVDLGQAAAQPWPRCGPRSTRGCSLGDALAEHPKVFTDLYVNMVRAGETAGNLEQVLYRLAEFLDSQVKLRARSPRRWSTRS